MTESIELPRPRSRQGSKSKVDDTFRKSMGIDLSQKLSPLRDRPVSGSHLPTPSLGIDRNLQPLERHGHLEPLKFDSTHATEQAVERNDHMELESSLNKMMPHRKLKALGQNEQVMVFDTSDTGPGSGSKAKPVTRPKLRRQSLEASR